MFNHPRNANPISSTGTIEPSTDSSTTIIDVKGSRNGAFHLYWSSLDAFNATAIMQGSNVNNASDEYWNDLGGSTGGATLERSPDSQIWEFKEFTTRFIRLSYQANNVTTGTITWQFEGY